MEPQDPNPGIQTRISQATDKPRIASEIRVAAWNEFDVGGFRLRQTLAAKLRKIDFWFLSAFAVAEVLLLLLDVRFFAAGGGTAWEIMAWGLATVFLFAYLAYRRRFLVRTLGEEPPANPVFVAIFEVDGFEYGRDVGSLILEERWIYFEGERTTFTLGSGQFHVEWSEMWFRSNRRATLVPWATDRHVNIHLVLEASKYPDFDEVFRYWLQNSLAERGIAVLPPLTPSKENESHVAPRSVSIHVVAATFSFIVLFVGMNSHAFWLEYLAWVLFPAVAVCVGLDLRRAYVSGQRRQAFQRLEKLRLRIEGEAG